MKKRIPLKLLISLLCIPPMAGCSISHQPIEVTFIDENSEIVAKETFTMLQNHNVPELNYAWEDHNFRGWAYEEDATSPKVKPGNTLKYSDLAKVTNARKINMYAVWLEKAELCIAYDAYTTGSGLTADIMNKFKAPLTAAIEEKFGFAPTINFRAYEDQAIEDKTAAIKRHGDVDVTVGFADTLTKPSTGNLLVTGLNNEFTILGKIRTLARINNKDLTVFAYDWFNDPENLKVLGHARTSSQDLVVGWGWNGNATGSSASTGVLDYQLVGGYFEKLLAHLSEQGFSGLDYTLRPYRNTPAYDCGALINGDGDVDILLGFGSNIPLSGEDKGNVDVFLAKTINVAGYNRYVYQLNTGSEIVDAAYSWMTSEEGVGALAREAHGTVTFGFDMRSNSGLTAEGVSAFEDAIKAYNASASLGYDLTFKNYTGETAEMGDAMKKDGVDIVIGMGSNFYTSGGLTFTASKNATFNGVASRRILQLDGYEEVATLMDWTLNSGLPYLGGELA